MDRVPPVRPVGLSVPVDTPAGVRMRWLVDTLAGRLPLEPAAVADQLAPSFRLSVPPVQLVASLLDVAADLGEVVVERLDPVSDYEMAARVVSEDLRLWVLRVVVEDVDPYAITSVSVSPARVPTEAGCSVPVPWTEVSAVADATLAPVMHTSLPPGLLAELDR